MPYLYELPTTGAVSFSSFIHDNSGSWTISIANATTARANLRSVLKESKRTEDGEKDYLKIIKPIILDGIAFSWRSTLSSHTFTSSPRVDFPTLFADLTFSLLTLGFALSNLAQTKVVALGQYELERHITDAERQKKDQELNFATTLLCKASGIFSYVSEKVIPDWEHEVEGVKMSRDLAPDVKKEVVDALAKMALADASQLSIRKLLTRSAYDSTLSPGPPLPRSHPSPALIAKLFLNAAALYTSARSLVKGSAKTHSSNSDDDVNPELRRHLADESVFCSAAAHKWLGVDAGEAERSGEAVGFLRWAVAELEGLSKDRKIDLKTGKSGKAARKDRLAEDLDGTKTFLRHYQNMNDSLHFLPVPSNADVQALVPTGRSAVQVKTYDPPTPTFGPFSVEGLRRQAEALEVQGQDGED
ncbi:hypothetical protein FRB96_008202 [Tulasnella sp. 330]|nr:hypothetical protein FRB96_008202 [Tulasnella sp. 330]